MSLYFLVSRQNLLNSKKFMTLLMFSQLLPLSSRKIANKKFTASDAWKLRERWCEKLSGKRKKILWSCVRKIFDDRVLDLFGAFLEAQIRCGLEKFLKDFVEIFGGKFVKISLRKFLEVSIQKFLKVSNKKFLEVSNKRFLENLIEYLLKMKVLFKIIFMISILW